MNKSVILTGILVFLTVVLAAVTKNDWQEANLRGKVKSIKTDLETTVYNQQGYLESIIKGNENYFDGDEVFTYDSNNRLLTDVSRDSDNKETFRISRTYDANGLLIKEVRKDYCEETDMLEYNDKKQLTRKKTFTLDGTFTTEYAYDPAGNKISENDFDEEMELYYKTIYTYGKSNKLVEKNGFNVWDTDVLNQTYKYDADGFVIEDTYYDRGELESHKEYFYDDYHNVTNEEIVELGRSVSYSFIYTYDKQGNWLTVEELHDGKSYRYGSKSRVITYY